MKIFQDLSELLNSMCEISALLLGSLIKASLILDHPSILFTENIIRRNKLYNLFHVLTCLQLSKKVAEKNQCLTHTVHNKCA